jgi:hypothetical protein
MVVVFLQSLEFATNALFVRTLTIAKFVRKDLVMNTLSSKLLDLKMLQPLLLLAFMIILNQKILNNNNSSKNNQAKMNYLSKLTNLLISSQEVVSEVDAIEAEVVTNNGETWPINLWILLKNTWPLICLLKKEKKKTVNSSKILAGDSASKDLSGQKLEQFS